MWAIAKGFQRHNIIKQLHDGFFPIERGCDLESSGNLQLLDEKFIINILCTSHKRGVLEL